MLSAPHRMRRSSDFGAAVRSGRRAGTRTVVVHVLRQPGDGPAVVGFVVSKAVGNAVQRNRTRRRLRALMRPVVPGLGAGTRVVVRANPAAASATTTALGQDLSSALLRAGVPAAPSASAASTDAEVRR